MSFGFCLNSRRYLISPGGTANCVHEDKDNAGCLRERCSYYEERQKGPRWWKRTVKQFVDEFRERLEKGPSK